jgi:hypothetical protein
MMYDWDRAQSSQPASLRRHHLSIGNRKLVVSGVDLLEIANPWAPNINARIQI